MSANVQSMIYVGTVPWHGLGTRFTTAPGSAADIIKSASLDWKTGFAPMFSMMGSEPETIPNFHTIYREDIFNETRSMKEAQLGVVDIQNDKIKIVQNTDTFFAIESILGKDVITETAASLGNGEKVFGCFKIDEGYKLIDDAVDHYLVIYNDHLKPDGKVTVLNTPVRVVCQNTLSAALSGTMMKYRIACTTDTTKNQSIAGFIKETVLQSQKQMTKRADEMLNKPLTRDHVEKILDELFPYIKADTGSTHDRANETTSMVRETFLTKCMDADNLQNYKGTQYQMFNALTDFVQHYYMSSTAGVDLEARMKAMPGLSSDYRMSKYLQLAPKLAA